MLVAATLVAATLCQWLVTGLAPESGAVGMAVPVPLSWEAVVPGLGTGHGGHWRSDAGLQRVDSLLAHRGYSPESPGLPLAPSSDLRTLFLLWGRLQLEGG